MENYFNGCMSLREVRHRYLALAKENHPVNGKDPITLFQVRMEYQQIPRDPFFGFYQHSEDIKDDFLHYPEVIDRLLGWRLNVELIGTWTWVSGKEGVDSRITFSDHFGGEEGVGLGVMEVWAWCMSFGNVCDYRESCKEAFTSFWNKMARM